MASRRPAMPPNYCRLPARTNSLRRRRCCRESTYLPLQHYCRSPARRLAAAGHWNAPDVSSTDVRIAAPPTSVRSVAFRSVQDGADTLESDIVVLVCTAKVEPGKMVDHPSTNRAGR